MKVHQRVSWWPVSGSCAVPCPLEHFACLPLARRAATCPVGLTLTRDVSFPRVVASSAVLTGSFCCTARGQLVHFIVNSHPGVSAPTTALQDEAEGGEQPRCSPLHRSSCREPGWSFASRVSSKITISSLEPSPGGLFKAGPHPPSLKSTNPSARGRVPGAGRCCACRAGVVRQLCSLSHPFAAGAFCHDTVESRVDGDGCDSRCDSPSSSSPFSFHSNSWRKKQPNHQSLKNPSHRLLSSPNIAAWCRSSTTRTG